MNTIKQSIQDFRCGLLLNGSLIIVTDVYAQYCCGFR